MEEQVVKRTVLESLAVLASLLMVVLWIGIAYTLMPVRITVAATMAEFGAWQLFKAGVGAEEVETESVGMTIAALIWALVFTLTLGFTDDLPLTLGTTATVVLTVTGTVTGQTFLKALLEQSHVVKGTVIAVIALPLIEFTKRLSSVTGMTALHYVACYNHITCGSYLVEAGANMQTENRCFRTHLRICSRRFRAAVQQTQSHQPQSLQ